MHVIGHETKGINIQRPLLRHVLQIRKHKQIIAILQEKRCLSGCTLRDMRYEVQGSNLPFGPEYPLYLSLSQELIKVHWNNLSYRPWAILPILALG
jgi:hypothetical protein